MPEEVSGKRGEEQGGGKKDAAGREDVGVGCCCRCVAVAAFMRRFSLPVPLESAVDTEFLR